MKLEQLLSELEAYVKDTETISFYVSKAKGVITVIAAHHFSDLISCKKAYQNTKVDFDNVAEKFEDLKSRYNYLYIKTNLVDENTAKHYDDVYNAGWNEKIKKEWRSDEYTLVSSISFKYPKKE